ncbi:MAG: hypothetical protein EXX96DRAFT_536199 [Benjaminiella poitrasii]|nr:MAG: hypothetical protein EXX96DRAFT_536199 [Benjaminiella poitrasii]
MTKNIEGKNRKTYAPYVGHFTIHGQTKNGSYVLSDPIGSIFPRNVPTSQIKLISSNMKKTENNDEEVYEVQAVINHPYKGPHKKLEHLTTWVGYPGEETWLSPSNLDSNDMIKEYPKHRNANKQKQVNVKPVLKNKRKATSEANNTKGTKRTRSTRKFIISYTISILTYLHAIFTWLLFRTACFYAGVGW